MATHGTKRTRRSKEGASSSDPAQNTVASLPPWPRLEGQKIAIARRFGDVPAKVLVREDVLHRTSTPEWDDYDSLLYNEWLKVKMSGTRVADSSTMRRLGIKDAVLRLLGNAGLGTIATKHYPLYPDLVRQFFASLQIGCRASTDEERDNIQNWVLSFKIRGVFYRISLQDLCAIYGFDQGFAHQDLPETLPDMQDFWERFGTGRYAAASSTHTDVRHPVLRYLLRLFSTTIMYKVEPGKMRLQELVLLSYALRFDIAHPIWDEIQPNMGVVFARYLLSLKHTPVTLKKSSKSFAAGSLITPIFQFCGIVTSVSTMDSTVYAVDLDYLTRTTWLKQPDHWVFRISPGQQRMVQLPLPALMDIASDPTCLAFQPDDRLVHAVSAGRKQITRDTAPASASDAGTSRAPHQIPPLPPVPDHPMEQHEFQSWVVQSLQTMWTAMSTWPRCGCVRPRPPTPRPSSSSSEEED